MVFFGGSLWFSVSLGSYWWFVMVYWHFLVVLVGSSLAGFRALLVSIGGFWWILVVLSDFLVVLDGCWCFCLVLDSSLLFLVVLGCS